MASKFDTLVDPFSAAPVDPTLYDIYGAPTITNGKLVLPNTKDVFQGVKTIADYDLTSSSVQILNASMILGASNQGFMQLIDGDVAISGAYEGGAHHLVEWLIDGGQIYARWSSNWDEVGTPTYTTLTGFPAPFNATNHKYLRFRHASGTTVIWESSSDGQTWSSAAGRGGSANIGISPTSMRLRLLAQSYAVVGSASWQIEQIGAQRNVGPPFEFGAYVDNWPYDSYASVVAPFEATLHTPLKYINGFIRAGGTTPDTWIDVTKLNALPAGHIPVLTIEFGDTSAGTQATNERRSNIISGALDSKIDTEITHALSYGKEIIIRPWHEMNGDWYPWSMKSGGDSNTLFIQAWQYLVNRFRNGGATNVKFIFCPNCDTVAGSTGPSTGTYWPGSAYVDYIGADGYEGAGFSGARRTFPQLFQSMYNTLTGLHSTAPFIVCETACEDQDFQPNYINSIYSSSAFPRMVGVLWFEIDKSSAGEADFRLTTAGLAALNDALDGAPAPDPGGGGTPPGGGGSPGSGTGAPTSVGELLVLDPAEVADKRTEFDLTPYVGEAGPDYGDAALEQYMADIRQGQLPVDYRVPNRVITIPLILTERDGETLDYDEIRTAIQQKASLLQREGGWIKRATTMGSVYAEVVGATLKFGGSTLAARYEIDVDATLTLTTLPDWFGNEVDLTYGDASSTPGEVDIIFTDQIMGDFPGRVRFKVQDVSGSQQRALVWGVRAKNYSADPSAQLSYECEALTVGTWDGAAIAFEPPDGQSGGSCVAISSLPLSTVDASQPGWYPNWKTLVETPIDGIGDMSHVGSYRVFVRAFAGHPSGAPEGQASGVRLRLNWSPGDLVFGIANPTAQIDVYGSFVLLDLGQIDIPPAVVGTHQWHGQIQAMSLGLGMQSYLDSTAPGTVLNDGTAPWHDNVLIDKLYLFPVGEGFGILKSYPPGYVDASGNWIDTGIDDAVVFPNKGLELRTEGAFREGTSGTGAYGPVSEVIGDLPRIPASGLEGRPVEMFFRISQGSADELLADAWLDNFSVQVSYRPSFLFIAE